MRVLGALAVAAAGLLLGIRSAEELRRREKLVRELCLFLERLRCELEELRSPLPELFASLGEGDGTLAPLWRVLSEGLFRGESFGPLWTGVMEALPRREGEILARLGSVLGRYGVSELIPVLDRCRRELELSLEEASRRRRELSRVYIGLGAAGGMMLAVLLW